jgi:hypothetical protein
MMMMMTMMMMMMNKKNEEKKRRAIERASDRSSERIGFLRRSRATSSASIRSTRREAFDALKTNTSSYVATGIVCAREDGFGWMNG